MAWKWKLRWGALVILIVFLVLPFEWLTPQGQVYRKVADSHAASAARKRASERRARAKGDLKEAERYREEAERIERQGWIYRRASYSHWRWPLLRPGGDRRPALD